MSEPSDILDRWFESEAWKNICTNANAFDDKDSIVLMEEVNDQLGSVIFHLKNDSGGDRLFYELKYFEELCKEFNVSDE